MKTKVYQKPTMKVEELQDCCDILAGSLLNASRDDYGKANGDGSEVIWDEE